MKRVLSYAIQKMTYGNETLGTYDSYAAALAAMDKLGTDAVAIIEVKENLEETEDDFEARLEETIEDALEAFWERVVENFPEATSGDFDPMYEGLMTFQATEWVRHWVKLNVNV